MKEIVRIRGADLNGRKNVVYGLTGIKGVGFTMAKAIVYAAKIDPKKKLGELSDEEIEKIEKVIEDPASFGIPSYLFNRRKDRETGKDIHLTGSDVEIKKKFDIQRLIEMKCWRGLRHMYGLPVRGRRLRGTFRRGKKLVLPTRKKKGRKG